MKKVFYYTDVLPFLSKPKAAIAKLKANLDIFKEESENIELIWHPWSRTEEYMKLNKCVVTAEYRKIVEEFQPAGWGTLDETADLEEIKKIALNCEAYYGDPCDVAFEAKSKSVAVMLQNTEVV